MMIQSIHRATILLALFFCAMHVFAEDNADKCCEEVLYHVLQARNINCDITALIEKKKAQMNEAIASIQAVAPMAAHDFGVGVAEALASTIEKKSISHEEVHNEIVALRDRLKSWNRNNVTHLCACVEWLEGKKSWDRNVQNLRNDVAAALQDTQECIGNSARATLHTLYIKSKQFCDEALQLLESSIERGKNGVELLADLSDMQLPEPMDPLSSIEQSSQFDTYIMRVFDRLALCEQYLAECEKSCTYYVHCELEGLARSEHFDHQLILEQVAVLEQQLKACMMHEQEKVMSAYQEGCTRLQDVMQQKLDELKGHVSSVVVDLAQDIECYEADSCKAATEYFVTCAERIRDVCASIYEQVHEGMYHVQLQADEIDNRVESLSCDVITPMNIVLSDFKAQQVALKQSVLLALEHLKSAISDTLFARVDETRTNLVTARLEAKRRVQFEQAEIQAHLNERLNETLYALAAYQYNADALLASVQANVNTYLQEQLSNLLHSSAIVDQKVIDAIDHTYEVLGKNFDQLLAAQLCTKRAQYAQLCEKLSALEMNVIKRIDHLTIEFDGLLNSLMDQVVKALDVFTSLIVQSATGLLAVFVIVTDYTVEAVKLVSLLTEIGLMISYDPAFFLLYCVV